MDLDKIDALNAVAREMLTIRLLMGSADDSAFGLADVAPGLHDMLCRWTDAIDAATASMTGAAGDVFTVELTSSEAAALRARAAYEARTPEEQVRSLVDSAIRRWENAECWP